MADITNNETDLEKVNMLTDKQIEFLEKSGRLTAFVEGKFQEAADHREATEQVWLDAYRHWRGEYSAEEKAALARLEEKVPNCSKVFVKITKTKVQAAIGQLYEVLFAQNSFPLGIEPTSKPEGVEEVATLEMKSSDTPSEPQDIYGYEGDGQELAPGTTTSGLARLKKKFGTIAENIGLKSGPSMDRMNKPEIYPALEAAKAAEKVIKDQLQESHAEFALRRFSFDQVCFGTGIIKGPVGHDKVLHKYEKTELGIEYNPEVKFAPKIEYVSVWDFYPDPTAKRIEDCDYVIQRHLMNKKQIRDLKANSTFKKDAINDILNRTPNYKTQGWEQDIKDDNRDSDSMKFEVLEFWGFIDYQMAKDWGLKVGKKKDVDIMVNIWVCQDQVLRIILNPFEPRRFPYFAAPYEEHPHQIWGVGVPENMKDTQDLMNGHYRMAIDNLKLAGNVVFEVDESTLRPGQDMTVYPGKVFRKQGGAPGQSIFSTKFQDTSQSHMILFDRARQLSDESTGIPSYSHGQTGVNSTTRTASGMSMLMSAAALNIKTVVKNTDHYLIRPLGEAMYQWNMQFNEEDLEMKGDITIVAKGTSSLMQKEVQSQRLISFMQILASNPITAPIGNYQYIVGEIAKALDLDVDKVINDPAVAAMYAQIQAQAQGGANANVNQNGQGGGQIPQGPGGQGGGEGNPNSNGNAGEAGITGNGGGTIGTGAVPQPGEGEFSASS